MAFAELFKNILGAVGSAESAKDARGDAEESRRERQALLRQLDWEPEYASQHIGPYQRTQSPVARSYLESFLTDSNADATWDGQHGAKRDQARQSMGFRRNYGSMEDLAARQREIEADTPWAVTPIERKVGGKEQDEKNVYAEHLGAGFTMDEAREIASRGLKIVDGKVIMGPGVTVTPEQWRKTWG